MFFPIVALGVGFPMTLIEAETCLLLMHAEGSKMVVIITCGVDVVVTNIGTPLRFVSFFGSFRSEEINREDDIFVDSQRLVIAGMHDYYCYYDYLNCYVALI